MASGHVGGLSGAFIPVSEDEGMIAAARSGVLTIDKLEAIVQHNESDISSWEPHEYQLNMTYADEAVAWSPVLKELREAIRDDTKAKIAAAERQA